MKKTVPIPMKVHIIIFLIPVVVIAAISLVIPSKPNPTAEPRSISSAEFNLAWTKSDIYIGEFLAIQGNCVLFIENTETLKCLDSASGQLIWEMPDPGLRTGITANESAIFISTHSPGTQNRCSHFLTPTPEPDPQCDIIIVTAYDVQSGQEKWSDIFRGIAVVSKLSADETALDVIGGGGHGVYDAALSIDAKTGILLDYQAYGRAALRPVREEVPELVKERDGVVSNTAVMDNAFYFLTADSTLWAIDETAGTTIAAATFQPTQTPQTLHDTYLVAANQGTIAVYFEDSQQLFVLKPNYEAGEW